MLRLAEALRRLLTIALAFGPGTFAFAPGLRAQQTVDVGATEIGGVVDQLERSRSRRLGHRRNNGSADKVRPHRRHRRSGPLSHSRSSGRELQRVGARLRSGRFSQDARQARHDLNLTAVIAPSDAAAAALLSGSLLVRDVEDPAGERLRRLNRYPEEHHTGQLAAADEQCRLHRLSSARPGSDAHDPRVVRQIRFRRRSVAAPHPVRPVR